MIVADYIIIAVVLTSMMFGFIRGFFREALSLVTWIAAIWIGFQFGDLLEPVLGDLLSSPGARLWVGRIALFTAVLVLGGLVTTLITMIVDKTGLTGVDRSLGMIFGFGRGILALGLLVIVGHLLQLEHESWWDDSALLPFGSQIADWLYDVFDVGVEYLDQVDTEILSTDT